MLPLLSEEIEAYLEKHSSPEPALFKQLAEETRKSTEKPQMMIDHVEGLLLRMLVRLTRARRVLELGTFTGYGAMAMAEGLPADGEIITSDLDPVSTKIAQKYWARSPHGSKIRLHLGPALKTLETIHPPLDLVFLDADKENYINYWEACIPKLRSGGVLAADNVLWSGRVLAPKEPDDHAIVAFNEHVSRDARVETVIVPIRDGVSVSIKL